MMTWYKIPNTTAAYTWVSKSQPPGSALDFFLVGSLEGEMDRQLYFGRAQVPKSSYIIILVSSHAKPPRSSEAGTKGLREEARGREGLLWRAAARQEKHGVTPCTLNHYQNKKLIWYKLTTHQANEFHDDSRLLDMLFIHYENNK